MSSVRQAMLVLINGLKQDISHYTLFSALLKEQFTLMQQHDSDKLMQLNQRQEKLHSAILTQAERRRKIMVGIGFTADEAGMQRLLNSLDRVSSERVSGLWERLKTLTLNCKKQNEINGKLLSAQQELLNKLLYPGQPEEYHPDADLTY